MGHALRADPGRAPLSVRTTEYDIDRKGAIAKVGWALGSHRLEAGLWTEDNDFNQARRFYAEPNINAPTQSFTSFRRNPLLTQWEYAFKTKTLQYHLQDEFAVGDTLKFVAGFKGMKVENNARPSPVPTRPAPSKRRRVSCRSSASLGRLGRAANCSGSPRATRAPS